MEKEKCKIEMDGPGLAAQGPPESGKVCMSSQKPGVQESFLAVSVQLVFRKFSYFVQLSAL